MVKIFNSDYYSNYSAFEDAVNAYIKELKNTHYKTTWLQSSTKSLTHITCVFEYN